MLFLKQIQYPVDIRKCAISGEPITYGQYYYEDDEDGVIIKFEVYKKLQAEAREDAFDYSLLEQAKSEKEYKEMMKRAQKEFLTATILDRQIAEKGKIYATGLPDRKE